MTARMRRAALDVMTALTTDAVLIPLMENGNATCELHIMCDSYQLGYCDTSHTYQYASMQKILIIRLRPIKKYYFNLGAGDTKFKRNLQCCAPPSTISKCLLCNLKLY